MNPPDEKQNGWERWRGGVDVSLRNISGSLKTIEENQGALHKRITDAIASGTKRTANLERRVAIITGGILTIGFIAGAVVAFFK